MISVAFFSLIERKVLSSSAIRVGPQYVGYWGLLQRFSDAIKLLTKENWYPYRGSLFIFYFSPIFTIALVLFIWLLFPYLEGGFFWVFSLLLFFCVRSLNVYPILRAGWSSNCKYSILGSLRSVAQIVSYEISLIIVILSIVLVSGSFKIEFILKKELFFYNIFLFYPLALIWFIRCLAETNRTPYDFSEGESELVSGFNTEYIARGFTLIFLREYAMIIFIRILTVILFLRRNTNFFFLIKLLIIGYLFIWVRATYPRYRYDKLIRLAWKRLLPLTLVFFCFFFFYISLRGFF